MEQDKFSQEFQRIYNRIYSRYFLVDSWESDCFTNKLTAEEFKAWTEITSKVRQAYEQGEISGEEFIRRVSENIDSE